MGMGVVAFERLYRASEGRVLEGRVGWRGEDEREVGKEGKKEDVDTAEDGVINRNYSPSPAPPSLHFPYGAAPDTKEACSATPPPCPPYSETYLRSATHTR